MLIEEEILQNRLGLMNNNLINKINKIARLDIDDDELEKLNLTSSFYYYGSVLGHQEKNINLPGQDNYLTK